MLCPPYDTLLPSLFCLANKFPSHFTSVNHKPHYFYWGQMVCSTGSIYAVGVQCYYTSLPTKCQYSKTTVPTSLLLSSLQLILFLSFFIKILWLTVLLMMVSRAHNSSITSVTSLHIFLPQGWITFPSSPSYSLPTTHTPTQLCGSVLLLCCLWPSVAILLLSSCPTYERDYSVSIPLFFTLFSLMSSSSSRLLQTFTT